MPILAKDPFTFIAPKLLSVISPELALSASLKIPVAIAPVAEITPFTPLFIVTESVLSSCLSL